MITPPHFGFFFRKALEGGTTFGFLIGLVGFIGFVGIAPFFFAGGAVTDGFTTGGFAGFLGGAFVAGSAFAPEGIFFSAVAGLVGLLTAGFAVSGLPGFFFAGLVTGTPLGGTFGSFGADSLGADSLDTGSFGVGSLLGGGSGLVSLTGGAIGVGIGAGIAGGTAGDASNTGEIQLRLTASESIALNCDNNSGASGTS